VIHKRLSVCSTQEARHNPIPEQLRNRATIFFARPIFILNIPNAHLSNQDTGRHHGERHTTEATALQDQERYPGPRQGSVTES
jgi:hypothetical protein